MTRPCVLKYKVVKGTTRRDMQVKMHYQLIESYDPIEKVPISKQLLVCESSRFLHKNIKLELLGRYIAKKSLRTIPEYKFISGLLPISVDRDIFHFGDYHEVKTKKKSLFYLSNCCDEDMVMSLYKDYYPDRNGLFQTVYKLIKEGQNI